MTIKIITNTENGTKYEIIKNDNGTYGYKYYELCCGAWRFMWGEDNYSKDAIEFDFDIKVA